MAAVELWVQEENARARAFYESRAWTFTGDERANDRGNFLRYVTPPLSPASVGHGADVRSVELIPQPREQRP